MTRQELIREVARATGETTQTIAKRGFSLLDEPTRWIENEPRTPLVVDWDAVYRPKARRARCAA